MKTSELTGAALDWAVAKCKGKKVAVCKNRRLWEWRGHGETWGDEVNYLTWNRGGPIIERERLSVVCQQGHPPFWSAGCPRAVYKGYGPTPLVAAMRCYVASKLGDEVDVPEELK